MILFDVKFDPNKVFRRFIERVQKIPLEIGKGGVEFAEATVKQLRLELMKRQHVWKGNLIREIKVIPGETESFVAMPAYGVSLDRQRPHFVKLKKGRLITKWAKKKGSRAVKLKAIREDSIFVKPHPYIDIAFRRSLSKLKPIMKRRLTKALGG